MALITELIDEADGHEIVTQAIGQIMAAEIKNQQLIAASKGKNPQAWAADVYVNRVKPFDTRLEGDDLSPLINVCFKSANYEEAGSTVRPQRADGQWNVDIYGFGESSKDPLTNEQNPGDLVAKKQIDRWLGIARKIIMSGQYTYLGSPRASHGKCPNLLNQWCYGRWVQSINTFQPELETRAAITCLGSRLSLNVHYLTDSPQILGEIFELLSVKVKRAKDGRLLVDKHIDLSELQGN